MMISDHILLDMKNKNYNVDMNTGIATFDIYNKDNVSNLLLLYLATHDFKKDGTHNKNVIGLLDEI